MGGLEESTGEGAAKVGGNASLTGASNDMSSRKEHLFKKNNRYPKNVKKHVLVAGEKEKKKKMKKETNNNTNKRMGESFWQYKLDSFSPKGLNTRHVDT